MTRADQLRAKAGRVGDELTSEKRRVLESPPGAERDQRLDRLTGLRTALSATNISLGAVPRLVAPENRDIAYDLIEEAYETIRWNIPLGPNEPQRPMPARLLPAQPGLEGVRRRPDADP
jgi:hypothetical protein